MKGLALGFKVEYSLFLDPKIRNINLRLRGKPHKIPLNGDPGHLTSFANVTHGIPKKS
jgi:hypothetical protein